MENARIFLVCLRKDDEITTWSEKLETSIEDVINKVKYDKNWIGGKFLEIKLEFENNDEYYKYSLDVKNNPFNQLLGS
jgi:hypothetical protein